MSITPVSAAPSKPLSPEEKRQRLADLRQRMGRSQLETTPPAGKVGYWAPKDDTHELGRLRYLGGAIVHDNPEKPVWVANGHQLDGTYIIGDVILLEFDAEVYALIQEEYVLRHEQMVTNTRAVFTGQAEGQGVPAFDVGELKPGGKAVTGITRT